MNKFKVLSFSGSLRKDSINKKLAKWASKELTKQDVIVNYIDMADYPLPVYNQDVDSFPESAIKLAQIMQEHEVWLISSPEYNYSIPGGFKNLIDFVSRAPSNQPNPTIFSNKIILLLSASPSNFGGYRGLKAARDMFTALGCIVIPAQACIANSFSAFDEKGELIQEADQKIVKDALKQLLDMSEKLV